MTRQLITAVAICATAGVAAAENIEIHMVDVDIAYSSATGEITQNGDPYDALSGAFFYVDGNEVGTLLSPEHDLGLTLSIPGVFGINPNGETVESAAGGSLELLIPDSALALSLETAEVVYQPVIGGVGTFRFTFVGSVGTVVSQALPFELAIGAPVTVTLSTQASTLLANQSEITSLKASGTGELSGDLVVDPNNNIPEPRTLAMLLALGVGTTLSAGRPCRS